MTRRHRYGPTTRHNLVMVTCSEHGAFLWAQEHHITAYDQLYQDGHRRMLRQEEYAHWCDPLLHFSISRPFAKPHQATHGSV